MSCYKPMHMAVIKFEDFKTAYHFKVMHKDKDPWKINLEHRRAYRLLSKNSRQVDIEAALKGYCHTIIEVPCGDCIGCRLDYSKDWANRASLEADNYEYNWFITLTYDDEHIVKGQYDNATLVQKHIDDFIRSLRDDYRNNKSHQGVKYLLCGEYGDLSARPHYHLILFNAPLDDLTFNFPDGEGHLTRHFDSRGVPYMFSEFIKSHWPYGNIMIADCNWNTSAYVSSYVLKKQKGKEGKKLYEKLGIIPPFLRMSNGIGKSYFDKNKEALADGANLFIPREHKKPLVSGLPRYFKKLLVRDGLVDYEKRCEEALAAARRGYSLLDGKQNINDNRSIKENQIISFNEVKKRIAQ